MIKRYKNLQLLSYSNSNHPHKRVWPRLPTRYGRCRLQYVQAPDLRIWSCSIQIWSRAWPLLPYIVWSSAMKF